MNACTDHTSSLHTISVVVPVFNAETTLTRVVDELIRAFDSDSFRSRKLTLTEIILVNDCGIDNSDRVMRDLASRFPQVRNV